jgi:hypothetical protein
MKRTLLLFTALLIAGFIFSQTDYRMYENTYLKVKTDKYKEFFEAITHHNKTYHNHGPHHARMWSVTTGPKAGTFLWQMGPCTFTDMDSRPDSKEHMEDWMYNVMPNVWGIDDGGYWRRDEKQVHAPTDSVSTKIIVTFFDLKDDSKHRFKEMVAQVVEVYNAKNYNNFFASYYPQFDSGDDRDAAVVYGFKKWANFDDEDREFKKDFEDVHGEGSWEIFRTEARDVIVETVDEIWELLPGLSGDFE